MANIEISDLPVAVGLGGSEDVPIVQGGTTKRTTTQAIADLIAVNFPLPIEDGGTGESTAGSAITALLPSQTGNAGQALVTDGNTASWQPTTGVGTVTSASVVTVNGFNGSVATPTSTPAISIGTTVTGLLQGSLGVVAAAPTTGAGSVVLNNTPSLSNVSINGGNITNLPAPVNPSDAATKAYADSVASGLSVRASCQAATAAALSSNTYNNGASGVGATLTATGNGALTIDGYSPSAADRILVKNEAASSHNGIYVVSQVGDGSHPYILTRSTDYDQGTECGAGTFTLILNGSTNANKSFAQTTTGTITIGTTGLVFTQINLGTTYSAGTGLSLTGTTFALNASAANLTNGTTGSGAVVLGTSPTIANPTLTTPALGTPTSGVLANATGLPLTTGVTGTLPIANGGTGQTTAQLAFNALSPATTQGDIIFRNAANNARLGAGTAGYLLQTNGAAANPTWAGFAQTLTGATTRTWQAKNADIYAARDFGITCNGSTDDASAMQVAVNSICNANGGILVMPPGNCILGSQITIPNTVNGVSRFELLGSGMFATSITAKSSFSGSSIFLVNGQTEISNLALSGNNQGVWGIDNRSASSILSSYHDIFFVSSTTPAGGFINNNPGVYNFYNNTVGSCYQGLYNADWGTGSRIQNNDIFTTGDAVTLTNAGHSNEGFHISGNQIGSTGGDGLVIARGLDLYIHDNGLTPINYASGKRGIRITGGGPIRVLNNWVEGIDVTSPTVGVASNTISIIDNFLPDGDAITFDGSTGGGINQVFVAFNMFEATAPASVLSFINIANAKISHNLAGNSGASGGPFESGGTNIQWDFNEFSGTGTWSAGSHLFFNRGGGVTNAVVGTHYDP